MNLGSKVGQKPVVVQKTEKLRERERKALFPSEGKGHDDDEQWFVQETGYETRQPSKNYLTWFSH